MATKTEGGMNFSSSAYLVVPDPGKPSTWKLRIEETPGKVTKAQLGRAAAALGKGFRGNKVQLSGADRAGAMRKLRSKYKGVGVMPKDMPMVMQQGLLDVAVAELHGTLSTMLEAGEIGEGQKERVQETLDILNEGMYMNGLTAIQSGALSYETILAAVARAVGEYQRDPATDMAEYPSCSIPATFPDSVVYEFDGKVFQIGYKMDGTEASVEGEPVEVSAEFAPVKPASTNQESLDLVEAFPSGVIKSANLKRDVGVIEGTTLITGSSQNGKNGKRRYPEAVLRKIASMAEGLPAYLNHTTPEMAFKPRRLEDLMGRHQNVRYDAASGSVKSDLHVAAHQVPLVFSLAEKFGDHIGNSLVSKGQIAMEGDTEVVQDILLLRSADLVSDPASTKGLFESKEDGDLDPTAAFATLIEEIRKSITPHQQVEGGETVDLAAILGFLKDKPADQKLLAEHFGFVVKDEAAKTAKDLTESIVGLTKERDALRVDVEAKAKLIEGKDVELKAKTAKVDEYVAKDAVAAKRVKLEEAIGAHDLGKKFGKVEGVVSDTFKGMLMESAEESWTKILDDRLAGVTKVASGVKLPLSEGKQEIKDGAIPEGMHAKLAAAF